MVLELVLELVLFVVCIFSNFSSFTDTEWLLLNSRECAFLFLFLSLETETETEFVVVPELEFVTTSGVCLVLFVFISIFLDIFVVFDPFVPVLVPTPALVPVPVLYLPVVYRWNYQVVPGIILQHIRVFTPLEPIHKQPHSSGIARWNPECIGFCY